MHKKQKYILDIFGKEPETLDELAECIIKVISQDVPVIGFAWQLTYNKCVSNTHYWPLDGVQNWHQISSRYSPLGYPGFCGRVWIRFAEEPKSFSSVFDKTLTHTGTGGGGSYRGPFEGISSFRFQKYKFSNPAGAYPSPIIYSWDYKIFISDWPLIKLYVDEIFTFNTIKGELSSQIMHRFEWQDLETVKRDKEFIKTCKVKG